MRRLSAARGKSRELAPLDASREGEGGEVSSKNRQQQRKEAERAQRRAAKEAQMRKRKRLQSWITRGIIAAAVIGAFIWTVDVPRLLRFDALAKSFTSPASSAAPTRTPTPPASAAPTPTKSASSPETSSTVTPSASPSASASASPSTSARKQWASAPPLSEAAGANTMTLRLNTGKITIALNSKAKATVASMAFLARQKYFDSTVCHRLTLSQSGISVLQCGDPTATGSGTPGYALPDENLPKAGKDGFAVYRTGTVAMANSGPNTGGSQFFLVYKDSPLPPNYTVWGTMTSGLDVVNRIAAGGTADGSPDGRPKSPVVITSATIR